MNWIAFGIAIVVLAGLFGLKRLSFVSEKIARDFLRQGAVVVDVRGPGEFRSGHLSDAVNIPLGELRGSLPRRFPDKNQVLLLHCLSGTRSGIAKQQLRRMGYRNVFNLGSYGRAQNIIRRTAA